METKRLIEVLTDLRQRVETEGEASCLVIETTLALALVDVCEALHLKPAQICAVIGMEAFDAVYSQAVPWAELREQVRRTYARSTNVVINELAPAAQTVPSQVST